MHIVYRFYMGYTFVFIPKLFHSETRHWHLGEPTWQWRSRGKAMPMAVPMPMVMDTARGTSKIVAMDSGVAMAASGHGHRQLR